MIDKQEQNNDEETQRFRVNVQKCVYLTRQSSPHRHRYVTFEAKWDTFNMGLFISGFAEPNVLK